MAPGVKPRKPLPRPALRGGVICGGGEKAPLLYPAPFSSPVLPLVPAVRRSSDHRRTSGSQAATGRFRWLGGAGMPLGGKARTNRPTRANSRERAGRASRPSRCLSTSPFPAHGFGQSLLHGSPPPVPPCPAATFGTGSRCSDSRSPLAPAVSL